MFGYDVHRITAPGALDGGDVLKVGDIMYVARGGRTNGEGIRQLRAVFSPLGVRVIAVPLTKVLHLKTAVTALPEPIAGCEECLKIGASWVHLRMCMTCGKIGCCDSSPNKHARAHFDAVQHPIIQSFEPGEDWRWCYADDAYVE